MKRKMSIIGALAACLLLSGCGSKTMSCTYEETDSEGYKLVDTYEITYNKDKVLKVKETATMEVDKDIVDMTVSLGESITKTYKDIDGFSMTIEKVDDTSVKTELIVDFEKLDLNTYEEKTGTKVNDKEFYSKKNITIDEFKKEYLKDYDCK